VIASVASGAAIRDLYHWLCSSPSQAVAAYRRWRMRLFSRRELEEQLRVYQALIPILLRERDEARNNHECRLS
jgi:hypothetical protein